jgi:hypothetical protein
MARAAPANIRSLARAHTELALRTLTGIASSGKNESARVAAATALLDRGWGRPAADVEDGEGLTIVIRRILEGPGIASADRSEPNGSSEVIDGEVIDPKR